MLINELKSELKEKEKGCGAEGVCGEILRVVSADSKQTVKSTSTYLCPTCQAKLSTLIKTSWKFARKSGEEIDKEIDWYMSYEIDDEKDKDIIAQAKAIYLELIELKDKRLKLIEIISYCESKAKEHKIDLEDGE